MRDMDALLLGAPAMAKAVHLNKRTMEYLIKEGHVRPFSIGGRHAIWRKELIRQLNSGPKPWTMRSILGHLPLHSPFQQFP